MAEYCYVTTTGRRTQRPHRIEIWYADAPSSRANTIYLLAGGRQRADWVRNLRADPHCTVEIDGRTYDGTARVVEGTGEDGIARASVYEKYAPTNGDLDGWRDEALPVAIELRRV
jgi:deazaflavin-dependent oxidoreductase (nitroreductase family)